MNEVLDALNPGNGVTVASVTVEDEYFSPPPELREMLKALSALMDLVLQTHLTSIFDGEADRCFTAAEVRSVANR